MEFFLLGPVEVRCARQIVPVGYGKQRAVLAALLFHPGRVVSVDELAEMLWWPRDPPPSARVTLRSYVKRLRQALGDSGRARISTQPGGYLIRVDGGELDVSRFEGPLGSARTAARGRSWVTAGDQARAALSLWRGEPLADVPSELMTTRELPRLRDLWWQGTETRVDADLQPGRSAEVTAELRQLVAAHPLREHIRARLMLSLYRSGRQSEALAACRQARQVLVDELGAEPGAELRDLHQRMLAADPALVIAGPAIDVAPGPVFVVPRELPGTAAHFTGREPELAALTRQLGELAGREAPGRS
jgi:DNA-binding SARP family transcriptional activator